MKRIALITIGWSLAKPPEEVDRDKKRVAEILEQMGLGDRFRPDKHYYDLDLEVGSKTFESLLNEILKNPDLGYISRIEHKYTQKELKSAPLLIWRPTNQSIEDDYYDLYRKRDEEGIGPYSRDCPICRARLEQVRDLMVNKTL